MKPIPILIIITLIILLFFYKRKTSFVYPTILVNTIKKLKAKGNTITGILSITAQNNNKFDINIDKGKIYIYVKNYKVGEFDIPTSKLAKKSDKVLDIPIKLNISTSILNLLNAITDKKLTLNIEGYIISKGIKIPFTDKYDII
jgi:LEA14-like dessication related protein